MSLYAVCLRLYTLSLSRVSDQTMASRATEYRFDSRQRQDFFFPNPIPYSVDSGGLVIRRKNGPGVILTTHRLMLRRRMYGAVFRLHVCFLMWYLIRDRQLYFLFLPLLLVNVNVSVRLYQFLVIKKRE